MRPLLLARAPVRDPDDTVTPPLEEDRRRDPEVRVRPANSSVVLSAEPRCVLVVDDDEVILEMLPLHLEPLLGPDVRIVTAATPEAALRVVREHREGPLVVLSDFDLRSATDGVDLLEEVGRHRPEAVRILFSGRTTEEIGDRLSAEAVHAFLEKPFRLDDMMQPLLAAIQEELGRRRGV